MKHFVLIVSVLLFQSCYSLHQSPEITHDELVSLTSHLSSDRFGGRLPGTEGDEISQKYILKEMSRSKLEPFIDDGMQILQVPFSAETGPSNSLTVNGIRFTLNTDFVPLALTSNDSIRKPVVFTGYGFQTKNDTAQWDDYAGMDVKGKWVMLLRGYPEANPAASGYKLAGADRTKVLTAKDNGAAGVLIVSGAVWDSADNLDRLAKGEHSAGIPVIQIKRNVADIILKASGETINGLEKRLNSELKPHSFETLSEAAGATEVTAKDVATANIVMMLEGNERKDEFVIVGAHFDHLGMGGMGSNSRAPETYSIHHGADDNASGVALMLEMAEKLASDRDGHSRTIVFIAFAAEEMGLLGSKYFTENMGIDPSRVNLMVNLDMVGRLGNGNGLQIGGVGTAAGLEEKIISMADTSLLSLSFTRHGYGPSDHSSFYKMDIPVMMVTTGVHLDYHTPEDTFDKLNYSGMVRIGNLLYDIVNYAANSAERLVFTEAGPKDFSQGMGRLRGVTLGIMPDFAGNVKNGLRADFVTPGKPAANGGMIKGDIIVAIDDKPVNNIEEYMYRLNQLKPGQTITVEVIRNEKHELLLIQL